MSYIEKFWRPATAADVVRVMDGETVAARFRDSEIHLWTSVRRLIGARAVEGPEIALRWLDCVSTWRYCQVYSPPQWFLDKPEPGEGFRLLEKFDHEPRQPKDDVFVDGTWRTTEGFGPQPETLWYRRRIEQPKPEPGEEYRLLEKSPDEALQAGDEFFEYERWWPVFLENPYPQVKGIWYRRRIEPPKPVPKFKVGQRVKIIGGISGPYIGKLAIIEAMVIESTGWFYELRYVEGSFHEPNLEPVEPKHYVLQVGDTVEFPDGWTVTAMGKGIFIK